MGLQALRRIPAVVLVLAGLLVPMLSLTLNLGQRWPWHTDNDFAHYYLTALLVRESGALYEVPLAPLYEEYGFSPSRPVDYATNPPALAALTAPLSLLTPWAAWLVWTAMQVLALVGSVVIGIRLLKIRATAGQTALLVLAALAMFPTVNHFRYGQVQSLILFLIVLGLFMLIRGRTASGAFVWGLATSLKLFTFPLLFVLWRYRDAKAVGWFMAGFAALHLMVSPKLGTAGFTDFVSLTLGRIAEASTAFAANVGAYGTAANTYSILTSRPLPGGSAWAGGGLIVLIAILVLDLRHKPQDGALPYSTAICLVASAYFSITCWPHYFVLMSFPLLALLASSVAGGRQRPSLLTVLVAYLLVSSTVGRLVNQSVGVELLTAWWGTIAVTMILVLLMRAADSRRGAMVELDPDPGAFGVA